MENISLVLWLCGFPITIAIIEFLDSAERQFKPKEPKTDEEEKSKRDIAFKIFLFYIIIAFILYN